MAFRIGEFVEEGALIHRRKNSVHGWLSFGNDEGIRFELTGNLPDELAGKHWEIKVPATTWRRANEEEAKMLDTLAMQQIGVVGSVSLRMVKVPLVPLEEFLALCKAGETPPVAEKPCLYLEWFSQNGRVVAEIVDAVLTCAPDEAERVAPPTPEPLPDADAAAAGPEITGIMQNEQGGYDEISFTNNEAEEDDDPYGLFPAGLDDELHDPESEAVDAFEAEGPAERPQRRSWDEVIPGIDPETKAMYEQWDEVIYGDKNEPFATLFDPPLLLKPPAYIESEAEAQTYLYTLLMRLALHSVSVHMCEHFTALETYRWLLEEILPESGVHPQLASTGWVQSYSTGEDCPACDAEFEAEYERRKKEEEGGE